MAITHTINNSWAGSTGGSLSGVVITSGTEEANLSVTLAANQTDTVVAFPMPTFSKGLASFYLEATCACTVKFYQGASLVNTLTLLANSPVLWTLGVGTAPIDLTTADMSQIKYTTAADISGTLDCRALFVEAH